MVEAKAPAVNDLDRIEDSEQLTRYRHTFPKVEKVKYNEKEARIYINQDQHFEGVAQEIWEYRIGGYQVCNKWLKDRKGETLSLEDIKRYCKVATAIQRTIKVQRNIDAIYSEVEKGIIEF